MEQRYFNVVRPLGIDAAGSINSSKIDISIRMTWEQGGWLQHRKGGRAACS